MSQVCFFNGNIIPIQNAHIQLTDLGIIRGYGVFDFLRTYNGKPFYLPRNIARFRHSAKLLGLTIPYTDKKITAAITTLIRKNNLSEAFIRMVATGGPTDDGITPRDPTVYILATPAEDLPHVLYTKGAKLILHEHQRMVPQAKTINYITAVQLLPQRRKMKALEVLYVSNGHVLECSTSNIFLFHNDVLVTPKENILLGMTRETVLKLAQKQFSIEERAIRVSELSTATELFLTASNKRIVPVVAIDGKSVGGGRPGKNTKHLMQLFNEYVAHY